jgi:hypothetical protein
MKLSQLLAQGMNAQDMLRAKPTQKFGRNWGVPTLFVSNAWPGPAQRARDLMPTPPHG